MSAATPKSRAERDVSMFAVVGHIPDVVTQHILNGVSIEFNRTLTKLELGVFSVSLAVRSEII